MNELSNLNSKNSFFIYLVKMMNWNYIIFDLITDRCTDCPWFNWKLLSFFQLACHTCTGQLYPYNFRMHHCAHMAPSHLANTYSFCSKYYIIRNHILILVQSHKQCSNATMCWHATMPMLVDLHIVDEYGF